VLGRTSVNLLALGIPMALLAIVGLYRLRTFPVVG
jgi:hypothetical protein